MWYSEYGNPHELSDIRPHARQGTRIEPSHRDVSRGVHQGRPHITHPETGHARPGAHGGSHPGIHRNSHPEIRHSTNTETHDTIHLEEGRRKDDPPPYTL
jgi:hypothetical protein